MFGRSKIRCREIITLAALGMVGALSPVRAHAEDMAVVVGINEYSHLENANLRGCVTDAQAMQAALQKRGFKVLLLTNGQATRQGVLDKLTQASSQVHQGDRFVFYFARHGTHDPSYKCFLLTADAEETNYTYTLTKEALAHAIAAIPTDKCTVLLDACHSEGLFRSAGLRGFHSRYHQLRAAQGRPKRLPNTNQTDNNDNIVGKEFCSFAACLRNQPAGEWEVGDVTHGVFTYFLTDLLNSSGPDASWDEVVTKVSAEVAEKMEQQQTPVFGPNTYRSHKIFDSKGDKKPEPNPSPGPRTLWEDYVDNKANEKYVRVMVQPDQSAFKIGEKINVSIQAGSEGYLVVLNKDNSGKVYLFSPDPAHASGEDLVKAAHVTTGTTRTIHSAAVDRGTERVKAILFRTAEDAKGLLDKFPKDGATEAQLRRLSRPRKLPHQGQDDNHGDSAWSYYTSLAQVDIVDSAKNGKSDDDDSGVSSRSPHGAPKSKTRPTP